MVVGQASTCQRGQPVACALEEMGELLLRRRTGEVVPLEAVAACGPCQGEIEFGLDTLGDDRQVADMGNLGQRGDQNARDLVLRQALDLALVDLDGVDRQRL